MQEKLKNIKETIALNLQNIKDLNALAELKNKYLSKKVIFLIFNIKYYLHLILIF